MYFKHGRPSGKALGEDAKSFHTTNASLIITMK